MSTRMRGSARAHQRGFTVVEMMVAVVVLGVGVLGLASASAVATRQMGGAIQMRRAAVVARARMEAIRAVSCTALTGGTATTGGFSERWTVTNVSKAVLDSEVVTYTTPRGPRTQVFTTMLPCLANP